MKGWILSLVVVAWAAGMAYGAEVPISDDSETCIECHEIYNPGIVEDWRRSRHAIVTPTDGLKRDKLERRLSVEKVPENLSNVVVGCAECHTMNPDTHRDTFDHEDFLVHVVVTPKDCAVCHAEEDLEYGRNLMAHARGNLVENPVYMSLVNAVIGIQDVKGLNATLKKPDDKTGADACLSCHGTAVEVNGTRTEETEEGEMTFPVLSGWPNQGAGRLNPDGSLGACAACHTRHQFAIEMARKPYTCSQCHKGPDVPAYPVYQVSKHGNILAALDKTWDFEAVPWTPGNDFSAPTCAACHVSLLVDEDGDVIAQRTHQMNNRTSWRLFGVPYAHAHSKSPETYKIKNRSGTPLAVDLTGKPASEYLIDKVEQEKRLQTMKTVCHACHSRSWVDGHFERLEHTIMTSNEMTLSATKLMLTAWEEGAAKGPSQNGDLFDEAIEKKWVEQWLFYANATRFASAMAGTDYGVFANGRWYLSRNIQDMIDWIKFTMNEKK
jgi:hydroxylamine dehydrogenase